MTARFMSYKETLSPDWVYFVASKIQNTGVVKTLNDLGYDAVEAVDVPGLPDWNWTAFIVTSPVSVSVPLGNLGLQYPGSLFAIVDPDLSPTSQTAFRTAIKGGEIVDNVSEGAVSAVTGVSEAIKGVGEGIGNAASAAGFIARNAVYIALGIATVAAAIGIWIYTRKAGK